MKTIKGDLIKLAEEGMFDVIVHGCNCFHAMGGGIAKQLADRYPEVERADQKTEFGDRNKLGTGRLVSVKSKTSDIWFWVFNVYTQYYWSHKGDVFEYDAFQKFLDYQSESMIRSEQLTIEFNLSKLRFGFPQIGAGLAGGDWSRISKMIEKFSEDVSDYADVTVVEYQP
jgi:O-acetyl-ADP-ribose deacetylase (regulator of RNase III)